MRRLLLVAVAFLLPACGGEEQAPEGGATPNGDVVEVVLNDFTIEPAALELEPGSYTFRVVNEGGQTHALDIEGPTDALETGDLAPGASIELPVELPEPGEWETYCPVDGHRSQGMEGTLTVGGGGGTTTGDDPTTTDEGSDYRY